MARWQLGQHEEANQNYKRAILWMANNHSNLGRDRAVALWDLEYLRAEAECLLGIDSPSAWPK